MQAEKFSEPLWFEPLGRHSITRAGGLGTISGLFFI
jgi:hypothetical protein